MDENVIFDSYEKSIIEIALLRYKTFLSDAEFVSLVDDVKGNFCSRQNIVDIIIKKLYAL